MDTCLTPRTLCCRVTIHLYEDLLRALLWPNAVAAAPLVPHSTPTIQPHLPTVCEGRDGFRVCMDVHQFQPREITLKTQGRDIVIEADHEDRPDEHGYVSRNFVRRYVLPEDYDIDHARSVVEAAFCTARTSLVEAAHVQGSAPGVLT